MGGGNKTNTTQQGYNQSGPWNVQQPFLNKAFDQANSIYNRTSGTPYDGNFVAQPTSDQNGIFASMLNRSGNSTTADQSADIGAQAAGRGANTLDSASGGLFNVAGSDATGGNINAAMQYANSPYMTGQIDAALTDARRNLNENQLPAIDRDAAATGGINSSRAGIASGVAERGFQETAANTAANMRGNAYEQGINQAQQDTQNRIGALTNAGNLGNAGMMGGLYGLANSANINNTNANTANLASSNITANNQAGLNNGIQKSQYGNQFPWSQLQNFYNIVGGNNWGATGQTYGNNTQTQTPSLMNSIGSGLGIFGSLFG